MNNIKILKEKDKQLKQELYVKKYKNSELYNKIYQTFVQSNCNKKEFIVKTHQIFSKAAESNSSLVLGSSGNGSSLGTSLAGGSSSNIFALLPPKQ